MTIPSKHRSRSRKRRGQAHLALKKVRLVVCTNCKKRIMPHRVCPFCGYYQGREVVTMKITKSKKGAGKEK